MRVRAKEGKTTTRKFESVNELLRFIDLHPTKSDWGAKVHSRYCSEEYSGTPSWDEADKLLRFGDDALRDKVKQELKQYAPKINATQVAYRNKVQSAIVGAAPHVPNYVAGVPTNMIRVYKQRTQTKILNVYYCASVSWKVTTEQIISASAKLLAAVSILEAQRYRVNLYVCFVVDDDNDRNKYNIVLKLKDAGQPFDFLKLAYPICHPSMLRRHVLAAIEGDTELRSADWRHGYGHPVNDITSIKQRLNKAGIKYDALVSIYDLLDKDFSAVVNALESK